MAHLEHGVTVFPLSISKHDGNDSDPSQESLSRQTQKVSKAKFCAALCQPHIC